MAVALTVRPVTPRLRAAFEAFFSARGCPGYCWCTPHRFPDAPRMDKQAKREAMLRRVADGVPVGVLAFDGDEPVGWCSVAPRTTYARLAASRVMPTVNEDAWTVLCLFLRRSHRDRGLSRHLVDGAVAYAREQGARVVEAYPFDTAGITATHMGHSRTYAACGFEREGDTRRWVLRTA